MSISGDKKFYGLYCFSLPKRCWSKDSNYVILSTPQKFNVKSFLVCLTTKVIIEIENSDGSSLIVVDVKGNYLLAEKTSLIKPSQLIIAEINPSSSELGHLSFVACTESISIPKSEDLFYENEEYTYNTNETVKTFNFTYFGKKDVSDKSIPLIVDSHGGPHVSYSNIFTCRHAFYTILGFGVLRVNYRGSTGMGGDTVDYLLGKAGVVDILDCVTATDKVCAKYASIDPNRINVVGGSHGGFISAHLSGQYPDKFKTALMANPVINLSAMYITTDIPDWCRAEIGCPMLQKDDKISYGELMQKMLEHSPIIHVDKVKIPTLLFLGSKDLRVPSSQGKSWYNRLAANKVKTKLIIYEDDHSLLKDPHEMDYVINSALWLMEHNDVVL